MMSMDKAKVKYGKNKSLDYQAISMAYKGMKLSMVILLPGKWYGLNELESKLTAEYLVNIDKTFKMCENREPVIFVPRFKLDETVQLREVLVKMGITDLFINCYYY